MLAGLGNNELWDFLCIMEISYLVLKMPQVAHWYDSFTLAHKNAPWGKLFFPHGRLSKYGLFARVNSKAPPEWAAPRAVSTQRDQPWDK